jgi:hypothetical protein
MSLFQFIRSEAENVTSIVTQQKQITSSILDTIKSFIPRIQSAWIGGDADEFAADVGRKVVPAMLELIAAIGGTNISLSKSVSIVDQADSQIKGLAGGVRDVFSKIF